LNGNGSANGSPTPDEVAASAGLIYISDDRPGFRRQRRGKGFIYLDEKRKHLRDQEHLRRIRALVIPPAWEDVWISPSPRGHIQAVGRDARGRKQYRYHPRWTEVRDENKYGRMIAFARTLPRIRRRLARDMRRAGLPREKVLATVVKLLETTLIRIGNDEYAKQNRSFGLTTFRDRHAEINGARIRFEFRGKSGAEHEIGIEDRRLARIVRKCQDLPGQELFQYIDEEGVRRDVTSADVNNYLREIAGEEFTAKDFRTWAGTVLAARALQEFEHFSSQTQAKKNVVRAVEKVAKKLGNTKAVCRKCYIHPAILDSYMEGNLLDTLTQRASQLFAKSAANLRAEEAAVLALLQRRLQRDARRKRPPRPVHRKK
jgi:DNA topoisomerase I